MTDYFHRVYGLQFLPVVDAKGEKKQLLQDVLKQGYMKEFPSHS
jgi:hypothetical protein